MRGYFCAFNGLVRSELVRFGENKSLKNGNTFDVVYREMFLQICRDYSTLPDAREIKAHEILFFFDGLRAELKEHTKPK